MGRSGAIIFTLVLIACTSSPKDDLEKAGELHNLSLKIADHVAGKIGSIEQEAMKLKGAKRAALMDSVALLDRSLAEWKGSLVEVPGQEHHHAHTHHHEPPPNLTPEMALDIQRELNSQIIGLNIRSQRLLDELKNQ